MTETSRDHSGSFDPPAPRAPGKKQRRNAIIQGVVALVVLVFIFGFLLPQAISYEQVWEILTTMEPWKLLVMFGAGLVLYVPEGWLYKILLPILSLWQGIKAWVASTAVATTVPVADLVTRFGMYRSYGATSESATLGILLSGVFDNLVKFSLPVIAVLLIGLGAGSFDGLVVVALIAGVVLIVGIVIVAGVIRSESFTIQLAERIQRSANWVLRKIKRDEIDDLSDRVLAFRTAGIDIVKDRWFIATIASLAGKLWTFVILLLAMRFVGIPTEVVGTLDLFIVWSIVLLIQSIPLTPGGIGIVALAYVALLGQIAGPQWRDAIAAGVALYRLVQWGLPIVVGWIVVWLWKRQIASGKLPNPFATNGAQA